MGFDFDLGFVLWPGFVKGRFFLRHQKVFISSLYAVVGYLVVVSIQFYSLSYALELLLSVCSHKKQSCYVVVNANHATEP